MKYVKKEKFISMKKKDVFVFVRLVNTIKIQINVKINVKIVKFIIQKQINMIVFVKKICILIQKQIHVKRYRCDSICEKNMYFNPESLSCEISRR